MSGGNAAETMTIKPGGFEAAIIVEENGSNDTVYVEVVLSTLYNYPCTTPTTTSSKNPNAGDQAMLNTSTLRLTPTPSNTDSTNADGMNKRGNWKVKSSSTLVTMTKGKPEPTHW